ncbi:MAG TPA: ABC transporter substrate-binding protein [Thermomicrobiales bacterium]|nr:ABC transporter substrate-binding protein [Thermomicrobiales bacterium]
MSNERGRITGNRLVTRRDALRGTAGIAGAATVGAALSRGVTAAPRTNREYSSRAQNGEIIFLSSQLTPIEEAEKMRNSILSGFDGSVEFVPEDPGPFVDRVTAEAQSGSGSVGVVGGLHGDFAQFVEQDLLEDLTDLADQLADRGFIEDYLELGRYGTESVYYIPWMQATYIMCAHRDALEYLPEGLTEETLSTDLTYEQLTQWGESLNENIGPVLGFPAGEDGLIHRFFQGYAYPSFTGGLNTTFSGPEAVAMWEWFRSAWAVTNPQALTYNNMDVPLQSGEVLVAWDHTARLINALRETPDDFVTFPAPRGPEGLGYLPAIAGLAIPKSAPDKESSRALIDYLTMPETQLTTLQEVAFFPVVDVELPEDLEAGIQAEADAIQATTSAENAITSLLPVGLGEQNGTYNKVFRDTFTAIAVDENDIQPVLDEQSQVLQEVLNTAEAECWAPDPESDGVCQVG